MTAEEPLRVLLLDDNPDDRTLVERELQRAFPTVAVAHVMDRERFERALETLAFDVVITDFQLKWTTGLEVLATVKARWSEVPVIMFTATATQEIAVDAMKAGLDDYVIKSPKHYVRLVVAVRSVLDRTEIRARALRSETRLHTLLEQIRIGVFRLGLGGELIDANGAFYAMLGQAERTSQALAAVAGHPLLIDARAQIPSLTQALDTLEREVRVGPPEDPDAGACGELDAASTRWFKLKLVRVRINGHEVVDGLLEETTHLRAADRAVRHANERLERRVAERTRELEEANKALETFGVSVSHDLREPLRTLQGYARALREDCAHALDARCRTYIERLDEVARRLDQMVADLLEFSRISRLDIALEPVALQHALDEAHLAVSDDSDISRLPISLERVGDPLPRVLAHLPTLVQVLTNLLSNALKFVEPGVAPQITVRAEGRGTRVRLWIEDRGIGIEPADQQRIFNVFERLHGEESYPGTGIGLALVKKGLERMGGDVGLESAPGSGSRFWIELSLA